MKSVFAACILVAANATLLAEMMESPYETPNEELA